MTLRRETPFSSVPPATPSSASQTLKGLFEMTLHPPRGFDNASALHLELQRYNDIVRHVDLASEVYRDSSKQLLQALCIC